MCVFVLFKTTCNFMASLRLKQEITNQYVRVSWTAEIRNMCCSVIDAEAVSNFGTQGATELTQCWIDPLLLISQEMAAVTRLCYCPRVELGGL